MQHVPNAKTKLFLQIRVYSEKEKSLRKNFAFFAKFHFKLFRVKIRNLKQMQKFLRKFINTDKIQIQPLWFSQKYFSEKCEISQKSLWNANENFRIFHETFPSLQTLLQIQEYRKSLLNINISAKVPFVVPGIETKMKLSLKKKFYHEKKQILFSLSYPQVSLNKF